MPRSRNRPGRKPYREREASPALAAKHKRDSVNQDRKNGTVIFGGNYGDDLSDQMIWQKTGPDNLIVARLNRKARRYGLKNGLLAYDSQGNLTKVSDEK